MSTLALRRTDAAARGLTNTGAALAIAAIAAGSTWFLDAWGLGRGLAIGVFLIGLLWLATTRRTPLALALLMIYLGAIDGFAKLATGSQPVTLVRDALLFAIVVGVLVRAQVSGERMKAPPLSAWAVGFVVLVLVQLLNPNAGTFLHSLAGLRQHLEFVPLFFLAYAFIRTPRALRTFVVLLTLIATANGIASWAQFNLTPEQLAGWGPGYAERVLGQGRFTESGRNFFTAEEQRTRPFGLGSDVGAGGLVGAFALGGVLALGALSSRLRYLLFAVAMAIGATTAIVTSQGRAAVVAAVIVVLTYGLLTAVSRRRVTGLVGFAVAGTVALVVIQGIVGAVGAENLRYQSLSASRILQTTEQDRGEAFAAIPQNIADYPLGAGLGTAGPAAGVSGANELVGLIDAESWFSFQTLETGVPGMLLLAGFTVLLLGLGVARVRHEPDPEARAMLAAIISPLAAILVLYAVGGGLTATTPSGPYLWTVGGIVAYWLVARPAARERGEL